MERKFNVASQSGLPGPIYRLYERFEEAEWPDDLLPDDQGWMLSSAFAGRVVGRIAIRDKLGRLVAERIGREAPYTRAQKCNLMRESAVLLRCEWPVNSIPVICNSSLTGIADELVHAKARRHRRQATSCNSGHLVTAPITTPTEKA